MTKYLYVFSVKKPFTETELDSVKRDICRVLECTEISVSGGTQFTLHSPLGPEKAESIVQELARKFGGQFTAGGKID